MKIRLSIIFLLGFSAIGFAANPREQKKSAAATPAFGVGEELSYRVHYGPLSAGTAELKIDNSIQSLYGSDVYHIKMTGKSAGMVDFMFKVKDEYETFMDVNDLVPVKMIKNVREGGYKDQDVVVFDQQKKVAIGKRGKTDITDKTQDILSALYYARSTDMSTAKIGDVFPVNFYMDGKSYQLRFRYVSREDLETDLGTFHTLVVKPQLLEGRVFKDQEALTLWVTDDQNKVPLRAESSIFVGSVKMDLISMKNLRNPVQSKVK